METIYALNEGGMKSRASIKEVYVLHFAVVLDYFAKLRIFQKRRDCRG